MVPLGSAKLWEGASLASPRVRLRCPDGVSTCISPRACGIRTRPPPPPGGGWDCTSASTTRAEWLSRMGAPQEWGCLSDPPRASLPVPCCENAVGEWCPGPHSTAETWANGADGQQVQEVPHIQHLPEVGSWPAARGVWSLPKHAGASEDRPTASVPLCVSTIELSKHRARAASRRGCRDKPTHGERFQLQGFKGF